MEEILASVRRILAEDEHGAQLVAPRVRAATGVLELTEAIGDDGTIRHIEPAPARIEAPIKPPVANGRAESMAPLRASADDRLVSGAATEAVATSFARLADVPRQSERLSDAALDQIARETLRPLLQAWLDAHLPPLVERLVEAEIARLVGDARNR
jgi:cell pole-organizing protein PopZ